MIIYYEILDVWGYILFIIMIEILDVCDVYFYYWNV